MYVFNISLVHHRHKIYTFFGEYTNDLKYSQRESNKNHDISYLCPRYS